MRMPFLVVRSEVPGLLCLNGRVAGEISTSPLVLPIAPEGDHWLTFYPSGEGCRTLRLPMRAGRIESLRLAEHDPARAAARVTGRAGGAWEIVFGEPEEPPRRAALPKTLEDIRLRDARISLVEHDGLHLTVENIAEDHMLAWHELRGMVSASLSEREIPALSVMLLGHDENKQRVVVLDSATGAVLLSAAGDEIEDGDTILVRDRLKDVAGHVAVTRFRWDGEAFLEDKSVSLPERTAPKNPEETALAMCQAVALNQETEALQYATQSMRARLQPGRLSLALGSFRECYPAGTLGDEVLVEVIQPVSPAFSVARLYAFRTMRTTGGDPPYLVDDLRCIEDGGA